MRADDPWLWTTDELIAEICDSFLFFEVGCTADSVPNAAALEYFLREQRITGAIFLTTSDFPALRDKVVFSQGQRNALNSVIGFLQHRSSTYQHHIATSGTEPPDLCNAAYSSPSNVSEQVTTDDQPGQKRRKLNNITKAPASVYFRNHVATAAESTARPFSEQLPLSENQWDHLRRWQQLNGDEEVNLEDLDRSEDEEQYGLEAFAEEDPRDEQYDHEIPEELEELENSVQGRSKLSRNQIVDIINERIAHYANSWEPNKGILKADEVIYDVEKMWDEAEATGQRQQLVIKYDRELAYYRQRLDQLCDEILKVPWSSVRQVHRQCSNLEVTINSMELAEWLWSIYGLDPISDSEIEPSDLAPDAQQNQSVPTSTHRSFQARRSVQVIDRESPSESSAEAHQATRNIDNFIEPVSKPHQARSQSVYQIYALDSAVANTVELPSKSPVQSSVVGRASLLSSMKSYNDEPEKASIASVQRWSWTDLIESRDRKRIVSKTVNDMETEDRELIRTRLKLVGKSNMIKEIPACIEMLSKGGSKMPGVLPRDLPKIITFTRLFLSWWLCDNYFHRNPAQWHLEELQQCLESGSPDPSTFCDYLSTIMSTTFDKEALRHPERPSQAEIVEISDDDDNELAHGLVTRRSGIGSELTGSQQDYAIILD